MEAIQPMATHRLNPSAPMFVPESYRSVDDFSDKWWSLVRSSPSFRDYWLQERFLDSSAADEDDVELFSDYFDSPDEIFPMPGEEESVGKELVKVGPMKWLKGKYTVQAPRNMQKAPKRVLVKLSPKIIQQPK